MKAAILEKTTNIKENDQPLKMVDLPVPEIGDRQILVKVSACGVCHTELDEIEGLVLTDNAKMLALCRKLGFRVKPEPDGVSIVSLSLEN